MLARVFTRLFYAAVFFALGVWAAPHLGGFGGLIDRGVAAGSAGFDSLWSWAESTISGAPQPAKPKVAAAPAAPTAVPAAPAATAPAKPAAPAPAPTAAPAKPAATAPTPAPAADSLEAARAMAARGDVSGAIRAYDELITKRPDEASLRGELGNVYWSAGRLQDAAKSYHGAATVLIAARRIDEATRLEPVVRKGDAALADDLARRLAEAARAR